MERRDHRPPASNRSKVGIRSVQSRGSTESSSLSVGYVVSVGLGPSHNEIVAVGSDPRALLAAEGVGGRTAVLGIYRGPAAGEAPEVDPPELVDPEAVATVLPCEDEAGLGRRRHDRPCL